MAGVTAKLFGVQRGRSGPTVRKYNSANCVWIMTTETNIEPWNRQPIIMLNGFIYVIYYVFYFGYITSNIVSFRKTTMSSYKTVLTQSGKGLMKN